MPIYIFFFYFLFTEKFAFPNANVTLEPRLRRCFELLINIQISIILQKWFEIANWIIYLQNFIKVQKLSQLLKKIQAFKSEVWVLSPHLPKLFEFRNPHSRFFHFSFRLRIGKAILNNGNIILTGFYPCLNFVSFFLLIASLHLSCYSLNNVFQHGRQTFKLNLIFVTYPLYLFSLLNQLSNIQYI